MFLSVVSWTATLSLLLAPSLCVPRGANVCSKEVRVPKNVTEKVQKAFTCRDREWSWSKLRYEDVDKTCYKQVTVTRIVNESVKEPTCCPGYSEVSGACQPQCSNCVHGRCTGPELCSCPSGFQGENCSDTCPAGVWGEKCEQKCDCASGSLSSNEEQSKLKAGSTTAFYCHYASGDCFCSPGWIGKRCDQICPVGFFGMKCTSVCHCADDERCHPAYGCCAQNSVDCGPQQARAYLASTESSALLPTLLTIGLVLLVLILVGFVFYYRRKWHRAKDPPLPNITFNSNGSSDYYTTSLPDNEFDNPLYSTSDRPPPYPGSSSAASVGAKKAPWFPSSAFLSNDAKSQQRNLEQMKLGVVDDSSSDKGSDDSGYERVKEKNPYDSLAGRSAPFKPPVAVRESRERTTDSDAAVRQSTAEGYATIDEMQRMQQGLK